MKIACLLLVLVAAPVAADPLTLTVVQLDGGRTLTGPTFYSTNTYFSLFADLGTPLASPAQLTVEAPLETHSWLYPAGVNGVATGFEIPRVYRPTAFTVTARLGDDEQRTTFTASSPVPEPGTWVLWLTGLLLIGGAQIARRVARGETKP